VSKGEKGHYPFDSWKVEWTKKTGIPKSKIITQLTWMRENWECNNIQPLFYKIPHGPPPPPPPPPKLPAPKKSRVSVLNQILKIGNFYKLLYYFVAVKSTHRKFLVYLKGTQKHVGWRDSFHKGCGWCSFSAHNCSRIPMMLSKGGKTIFILIFLSQCFTSRNSKGVGGSESKALSTPRLHLGQVLTSGKKVVRSTLHLKESDYVIQIIM
jgi:hypothetical protein